MILIITNKKDYTADYLILKLKERNIDFFRLNTEDFPQSIDLVLNVNDKGINGYLNTPQKIIQVDEISSAWYRRPLPSNLETKELEHAAKEFIRVESEETLVGLWKILPCFWVSYPDNIRAAESKIWQLKLASEIGFAIPQTLITNSSWEARTFFNEIDSIIYKPQRHGRIIQNGSTSFIYTSIVKKQHMNQIESNRFAPSLFQKHVQKNLELRITVVGEKTFAVEIYSQEVIEALYDWRRADTGKLLHRPHRLREDIKSKCISLVKKLGLRFGAIDMILTPQGEYVFLEINPNGQWAWIQELCPELQIREALIDLLVNGDSR